MSSIHSAVTDLEEYAGEEESVVPVADHLHRRSNGAMHILHVDDDSQLLELASTFLETNEASIDVSTKLHAEDALNYYHRNEDSIECIVSDYDMPEMDGLELLRAVRAEHPEIPFILFTGKGSEAVASDAIAAGVTEYMQKEVGTDQYEVLANRVRNTVEQYRMERAYQTARSWYQRLCEQSLAGTYLVHDEALVYVNEKFATVFGYEQADLIGADPLSVVAEEDRPKVQENLRKRLQGEHDTIRYQFTGKRKDGDRIEIDVAGGAIEFGGEPAVLGILTEISG